MQFVIGGLSLAIYWVGAYIINGAGMMDKIGLFSDMDVFLSYAMQVVSAFIMLVIVFMLLPRTIVSIKRIEEVLTCSPSIMDGSVAITKQVGTIEFKDVNFKYPDGQDYVLSNINLKIEKGETVAAFDKIQLASFEEMKKFVSANGGFDNRAHVWWEDTKELHMTFLKGVFSIKITTVAGATVKDLF